MGLFDKLKNVLFEEEEVEEEIVENKVKVEPEKVEIEEVKEYKPLPEHNVEPKVKEPTFEKVETNDFSERELFKSDSTFKFPAFDEEEFNTSMPRLKPEPEVKSNNVMDYERRNRQERRNEYSRLGSDHGFVNEEKPREEVKRFKPSPVISPVYGILDKDYKAEDIKKVEKDEDNKILSTKDYVESVRAKAFGKLKEADAKKPAKTKEIPVTETYDINKDEKEVKEEVLIDDVIITDEPIIEDSSKLMEERTKTIDELLKDASDTVIDAADDVSDDTRDISEIIDEACDDISNAVDEEYEKIENAIDESIGELDIPENDEIIEDKKEEKDESDSLENDTLENDLYDLIDSMYDNTEDGE